MSPRQIGFWRSAFTAQKTCIDLFGEQGELVVSHQVDRLCNGPNIDARFQTLDAASKNGSHIGAGENLSFNQTLKKGERSHTIGDCAMP